MSSPTVRGLSVSQGAALTIGAVLGTGVLTLPSVAARIAGPASLLAWALLVLLSIPLAATFAALGSRYPGGGGVAGFAGRAFGPGAASAVGWCFYLAIATGATPAASFAGAYVADAIGGGRTTNLVASGVVILLVAAMNWFGIQVSARIQLLIAASLAALLALATLVALPHVEMANFVPFAPHGWLAIGTAAALLVWAFAGWEAVSSLTGEYRDPGRDVPRATVVAVVVIGLLYLGVAFATVAALGPGAGPAPLSQLLVLGLGPVARPLTTVLAVLLTVGAMNVYFAGGARLGAALGREGAMPRWLGGGAGEHGIPRRSLVVETALGLTTLVVVGLSGLPPDATMLVVTGSFTLVYLVGTASAVRLLPPGSWVRRAAGLSFVAAIGLLLLTGPRMIFALIVAAAAVAWQRWRRLQTVR